MSAPSAMGATVGSSRKVLLAEPQPQAPAAPGAAAPAELPVTPADLQGAALTPMMRQYLEAKAQVPDAFLFFRLGDFYELFFEDAVRAAELLNITLTARSKGADKVPMAGVPYHAARRYVARLVEAGHKVAICEQVEEANGPAIVRREVVRVVTPGMVLDEDVLDARENNFLLALLPGTGDGDAWGAALLDASTGEFAALEPGPLDALQDELVRAAPRELLVPDGAQGPGLEAVLQLFARRPALATLPPDAFLESRARAALLQHLQAATLEGFGVDGAGPSLGAAGAALRYLKDTQKSSAGHVDRIHLQRRGGHLVLDEASRQNLELLRNLRDGTRAGTLLQVVDRTRTPMGARKLARWLVAPLGQVAAIEARLDAVEELYGHAVWRDALAKALAQVADVERLCARLSLASGGPRDLRALGRSLAALPELAKVLEPAKAALLQGLRSPLLSPPVLELAATLERALVDEPPAVVADGGFIREGFDAALDEVAGLAASGKDYLAKLEGRERGRTGIASLKVRFNRVFGYYLEVTKPNLHLVPKDWVRKQTTAGAERFTTDELKDYEEKVLTADEQRIAREQALFEQLRSQVVAKAGPLRAASEAIATLDVLACFARVSAELGYARPQVDESDVLEIVGGRHPVVERALQGERFVPNDVRLDRQTCQLMVITGPNMAGKSTVMRQVALTVVLAQAGCFVPAARARIGLCDRVFTRVGASDNLARGQSTFMVEMTETATILHHATRRSLVVLDEIGRGTSTFDGLSIAWAVAEQLHDRIGARTLFATHYHELTDLARERPKVKNACIAVREQGGRVTFLRTLIAGAASKSYGIEVARLAGLPAEVLARARELLANLEAGEFDEAGRPRLARHAQGDPRPAGRPSTDQLGLFAPPAPLPQVKEPDPRYAQVAEAVKAFRVEASTPLDALNAIARWKQGLDDV